MRRGRLTILVGTLATFVATALVVASGAAAADPKQICADLADNGKLDGTYTQEELAAAMGSLQGYCTFVVVVTPPTPPAPPPPPATQQVCTEVAPGTPGAVQAPNGKWYTNAPNGNAEACGPAAAVTPPAPPAPAATPPVPPAAPPAPPAGGTLPGQKTITSQPKPTAQPSAQPATGVAGQQSPLRQTRTTGTLPFTGAELAIFALIGAALIGAGLLLRATSRQRAESS
jgi:hypothetical protein